MDIEVLQKAAIDWKRYDVEVDRLNWELKVAKETLDSATAAIISMMNESGIPRFEVPGVGLLKPGERTMPATVSDEEALEQFIAAHQFADGGVSAPPLRKKIDAVTVRDWLKWCRETGQDLPADLATIGIYEYKKPTLSVTTTKGKK